MQFTGRQRRAIANPKTELYGHCLQFYGQPPLENISLTEFETFAVERLKRKTYLLLLRLLYQRILLEYKLQKSIKIVHISIIFVFSLQC